LGRSVHRRFDPGKFWGGCATHLEVFDVTLDSDTFDSNSFASCDG
jgi:hypothetical protein